MFLLVKVYLVFFLVLKFHLTLKYTLDSRFLYYCLTVFSLIYNPLSDQSTAAIDATELACDDKRSFQSRLAVLCTNYQSQTADYSSTSEFINLIVKMFSL